MRFALPSSALVHASVIGSLLIGFNWQQAEDAAAPAPVAVSIISVSTALANESETLESDSSLSAISAGSFTGSDIPPEVIEPIPPEETAVDVAALVEPTPVLPLEPEDAEPLFQRSEPELAEAEPPIEQIEAERAELTTADVTTELVSALAPVQAEPIEIAELAEAVELPQIALPTARDQRPADQPQKSRESQMRREAAQRPRPVQAGNGGNAAADSAAAARPQAAVVAASNNGAGGEADVAKYPSQVMNKLRRASRQIGQSGEPWVRFTVQTNGQVGGISVIKSSGKPEVDNAALALVQRASPFPPIPAAANRTNWTFELPITFARR
jgi:protein TonB